MMDIKIYHENQIQIKKRSGQKILQSEIHVHTNIGTKRNTRARRNLLDDPLLQYTISTISHVLTNIYCSQKVGDIRILKIITFTKRMS